MARAAPPRRRGDRAPFLHRIATLTAARRQARAFLDEQGRDPEDEVLAAFLERLRAALRELVSGRRDPPRPGGPTSRSGSRSAREPGPDAALRGVDAGLTRATAGAAHLPEDVVLLLLGLERGPSALGALPRRAGRWPGRSRRAQQESALEAMIDLLRDPRCARGAGDPGRAAAPAGLAVRAGDPGREPGPPRGRSRRRPRRPTSGSPSGSPSARRPASDVEPVVQKRGARRASSPRGRGCSGTSCPTGATLTAADRRAYQAYDDRFARAAGGLGHRQHADARPRCSASCARSSITRPCSSRRRPREAARLDIRQGRLRLRFATAADGSLAAPVRAAGGHPAGRPRWPRPCATSAT